MPEYPICPHNDKQPVTTGACRVVPVPAQPVPALTEQLNALVQLPTPDLKKHWCRLYHTQPPARMTRNLLLLAVGWKMQARTLGALDAVAKRKLRAAAAGNGKRGTGAMGSSVRLKPGTRLIREWHGEIHEIIVLETGFEWNHQHYRSLSDIAGQITGAHWSGPRFFGLRPKPDHFSRATGKPNA